MAFILLRTPAGNEDARRRNMVSKRRSWGGYWILFMLVYTQLRGLSAVIWGSETAARVFGTSPNATAEGVIAVLWAFVYGMCYKRKWVKWYIIFCLAAVWVVGGAQLLTNYVWGYFNQTAFDIFNAYWKQGLLLGASVIVWEAVAGVIWCARYGIGSVSSYISNRLGNRFATRRLRRADSVARVGDDPGGVATGSRWPLTMSRPQVVVGLCIGAALVSSLAAYAMVVYWPSEDLGIRLRRECESIIRETGGNDLSDYGREVRIRSCIEARARGGR